MKIAGIVAEYNPFHNGHAYHIQQTRNNGATHIVAVMSPNFVQRGECAIFDKFTRANVAVKNGVDLVIELPTPYALSSAEFFALGAVKLLDSLGCVDMISFGSECGRIETLKSVCDITETERYKEILKRFLNNGVSFPKAQSNALTEVFGNDIGEIVTKPNNLLGIEYLRALNELKSSITPITIKREGAEHDSCESDGSFASASKIRETFLSQISIISQNFLPCNAFEAYKQEISQKNAPFVLKNAEKAIIYKLRSIESEQLKNISDVNEGLENRIVSAANECEDLEGLFQMIKCKRYTMARIKRIICCTFNDITKDMQKIAPPYIRVLAFNEKGREVIKKLSSTATLPFSTSLLELSQQNGICKRFTDTESRCTDNFLLCSSKIFKKGYDYTTKVAIIK